MFGLELRSSSWVLELRHHETLQARAQASSIKIVTVIHRGVQFLSRLSFPKKGERRQLSNFAHCSKIDRELLRKVPMPKVYFKSRNHGTGVQAWREANGLAKATTLVLFSRILQMLLGQIPYHRIILKEVLPG